MANLTVYILPSVTLADDQSGEPQHELKVQGYSKSFHYDGQSYTLNPGEYKSVPELVANAWVAADSQVQIAYEGFRVA